MFRMELKVKVIVQKNVVKVLSTGRAFSVPSEGVKPVLGRIPLCPVRLAVRNCSVRVRGAR